MNRNTAGNAGRLHIPTQGKRLWSPNDDPSEVFGIAASSTPKRQLCPIFAAMLKSALAWEEEHGPAE